MLRAVFTTTIVLLATATGADARTLTPATGPLPKPAGITTISDRAYCGDIAQGCAYPWGDTIWVRTLTDHDTISHELGHIYLWRAFFTLAPEPRRTTADWWVPKPETAAQREQLTHLLGYDPGTPWHNSDEYERAYAEGDVDYMTANPPPQELAADAYMACDRNTGPRRVQVKARKRHGQKATRTRVVASPTGFGYAPPTVRRHLRICSLIASLDPAGL